MKKLDWNILIRPQATYLIDLGPAGEKRMFGYELKPEHIDQVIRKQAENIPDHLENKVALLESISFWVHSASNEKVKVVDQQDGVITFESLDETDSPEYKTSFVIFLEDFEPNL